MSTHSKIKSGKNKDIRTRIILASEQLFARKGIEGSSLREIAVVSGTRNNFAVQYHFGTKEALVHEIFRYRMLAMESMRGRLLDEAEEEGRLDDLRTLLRIVCLPHLALANANGEHPYASFLLQYLLRNPAPASFLRPSNHLDLPPPHLRRVQELIRKRLSYLPAPVVLRRITSAIQMFLSALVYHEAVPPSVRDCEDFDFVLEDTMDQMVAAIGQPLHVPRKDLRMT